MRMYLWDFADGHGQGTAKQYLLHLRDFLRDHGLQDVESGVLKTADGFSAWCKAPPSAHRVIEEVLKPPRYIDEP